MRLSEKAGRTKIALGCFKGNAIRRMGPLPTEHIRSTALKVYDLVSRTKHLDAVHVLSEFATSESASYPTPPPCRCTHSAWVKKHYYGTVSCLEQM